MYLSDDENEYNYRNHHILWHQERNFILYMTPKAGNSSLKKSILEGMGYGLNQEYPAGFKFVSPKNVYALKKSVYPEIIGFTRNPYDRIYSCWADKMNVDNTETFKWGKGFWKGMSFMSFLMEIEKTSMKKLNIHARSMTQEMVYAGEFLPTSYFKFEHFTDPKLWHILSDYFLDELKIKLEPLPHLNKSKSSHIITDTERGLIRQIYDEDFELFVY